MSGQKEKYARVSFFLKDVKTNKIYAVTPSHVANFINDKAFLKTENGKVVLVKRLKCENILTKENLAIIEVEHCDLKNISNKVVTDSGPSRQIAIYNGTKNEIYGKPVFKCVYSTTEIKTATEHTAYIASREEHREKSYLENEKFFFIKNEATPFSRPGDSGAPVCFQSTEQSSDVIVVGIISGGDDDSTNCLYLPRAFEECLAPESFDLAQRVKIDTSWDLYQVENDQTVTMSLSKLKELRMRVNQRFNCEDLAIFENDDPIFLAFYCRLYACDCLYDGKRDEAELRLKTALRCAEKHAYLSIHFFPKLLTIITWLFLEQNKLDTMIETLDVSKEFANDHTQLSGFPVEVQPYLYYDSSRCNRALYEQMVKAGNQVSVAAYRHKAIQNGRVAWNLISCVYLHSKNDEHLDRYVLIGCEFAVTLLGCGGEFECKIQTVDGDHLQEAEVVLSKLHSHISDVPLVQQLVYNQAMCDLNYRKQNVSEAHHFAKIYEQLAKEANNYETHRARMRVDYIRQLLQRRDVN
ncbi:hypothetical protein MAR_031645 [Mya arenaria]|uniref:Uncharacterized protein n=1 Tax=Mya arenaria TaxID=6604 RepID=A0ABY7FCN7_MYAAR|nr:hypothetical protein MAR_031645 [Mya arenaria]